MTIAEWDKKWFEGLEALDALTANIERHKHNLSVIEQELDRLDEIENRIPQQKGLLSWLFKENK